RRYDVPTTASLTLTATRFRTRQNPNGSWGYSADIPDLLYDSTTCAGLIGLATGQGVVLESANQGNEQRGDPAIEKAFIHLSTVVGRRTKLSESERRRRAEQTIQLAALSTAAGLQTPLNVELHHRLNHAGPTEFRASRKLS